MNQNKKSINMKFSSIKIIYSLSIKSPRNILCNITVYFKICFNFSFFVIIICRFISLVPSLESLRKEVDCLAECIRGLKNNPAISFCHNDLLVANFIHDEYDGMYILITVLLLSLLSLKYY